jgi:hypothetical protein
MVNKNKGDETNNTYVIYLIFEIQVGFIQHLMGIYVQSKYM